MKSKFPGYFKPTEAEIGELWENAIFTIDANVLLNLYRYSNETKEELLKIFEKIKDRVWIPNQAAKEFFENKLSVINQQEKAYDAATTAINSIETEFRNSRQHPFISNKLLKKFSSLAKDICKELSENKKSHSNRILNDDILERIEELFSDKVGDPFSEDEISDLVKIGEERFSKKIPPGFKDANKTDNTEKSIRRFGDFFVWKQIINYSKETKQSVILVTDDRKEDWWTRFKGKTLQPRPELIREFKKETENSFHMYQSDRFLEFARKFLKEEVKQEAINEIRELRKMDEKRILRQLQLEEEYIKSKEREKRILREQHVFEKELQYLRDKKSNLEKKLQKEILILENEDPNAFDDSRMKSLQENIHHLKIKERELFEQLEMLKYDERRIIRERRMVL